MINSPRSCHQDVEVGSIVHRTREKRQEGQIGSGQGFADTLVVALVLPSPFPSPLL